MSIARSPLVVIIAIIFIAIIAVVLPPAWLAPMAHAQSTSDARIKHGIPYVGTPWTRRWDAAQGVLFFGKHFRVQKDTPLPSYNADGTQRGADIDLYKDFPRLDHPNIDDFAAGTNGTTIIAVELMFGPKDGKYLILTYDADGKLLSEFDPRPYTANAIAADDEGNIYLLGDSSDETDDGPPYPLLMKYDSSGNVIGRAIPSNVFKSGSDAIDDLFNRGEEPVSSSVALLDGKLFVYAPSEKELLVCSPDGKILRRVNLETVAANIARADKVHHAEIADVAFVDRDHVVLSVMEYLKAGEPNVLDIRNLRTAAYLVDLTTQEFKLILRGEQDLYPAFLGVKENQLITLSRGEQGWEMGAHDLP
jgi:hypothetical protein